MQNNDLSNQLTRRVLVTLDVVARDEVGVSKRMRVIPVVTKTQILDKAILSRLYLYNNKTGFTLELVSFGISEDALETTYNRIDNLGTNPFRYFSAYASTEHLVAELPYRPEVVGVLDLPNKLLRYGHWGLDFTQL